MVSLVAIAVMAVIFFHTCVASAWDAHIGSLFTGKTSFTVREGFACALIETITVFSFFGIMFTVISVSHSFITVISIRSWFFIMCAYLLISEQFIVFALVDTIANLECG